MAEQRMTWWLPRLVGGGFLVIGAFLLKAEVRFSGPSGELRKADADSLRAASPLVIPTHAAGVERQVAEAIKGGGAEPGGWAGARRELLDLTVPREEAIRIAKTYLGHSNPMLRYGAADTLYMLGDRSGAQALIDLVRSSEPMRAGKIDLRALAAMTLADNRETRGAEAVANLYFSTKDPDVRSYAVILGVQQVGPEILEDLRRRVSKSEMYELACLGVEEAKPLIIAQFQNESAAPDIRVAAAGAMLRFGEQEPYFGYLCEMVERAVSDDPVRGDLRLRLAGELAVRRLGRIHDERARGVLEKVLYSKDVLIAEAALVQLRVKYPDSVKARERLVQAIQHPDGIGATTTYRLAAMTDDQEIRRLAAQRDPLLWQQFAIHERDWEIDKWLRSAGAK